MADTLPAEDPPAAADAEEETGPLRRCIVTGERRAKETMIRFVVGPDGALVPDVGSALPGRGLWLTAQRDILATALKKRAFDRAARRTVAVPSDLATLIETLLAVRCRDGIGLARRAGKAVAGFEKVKEALRAGPAGVLLTASDGAAGGRQKLAGLARGVPEAMALTAAELGAAFGRDHTVHAVVAPGPLAVRLRTDMTRLAGFRTPPAGGADDTPATQILRQA